MADRTIVPWGRTTDAISRPHRMGSTKKPLQLLLISGVLVLAIVAVYGQMRGHDAIHFDDNYYVTENDTVQRGLTWAGIEWAFTTSTLGIWHPLTSLSHMLDCQLFGMDMGLHHLASLALHIVDTLLLLLLLHQLTGAVWRPAFVAALFALHPLNVESVAWIAERKNVLSTMFWLLTTISYVAWVRRPTVWRYVLTLVLFALGLMAKPMLVTLPFTLLLLDYWPLGRTRFLARAALPHDARPDGAPASLVQLSFGRLLLEKLPFFALTLAASYITFALQRDVVVTASGAFPLLMRPVGAVISYGSYLVSTVWPHDLAVLYPFEHSFDARKLLVAVAMLSLLTWWTFRARVRQPYLLVGWLWYLGTFVPVIGIVHVGSQTRADRYAYVPLIGVFVMIAWGAAVAVARWPRIKGVVVAGSVAALLALGAKTWRQTALWKDSITLFEHTLSVTENNLVMQNAIGVALGHEGRHEEAIAHFREAMRLRPDSAEVLDSLGLEYASLGRFDEAVQCFRDVIAMRPMWYQTHVTLGLALAQLGKNDEALEHYREALRQNPDYPEAHAILGSLLASQDKYDEAIDHFRQALARNPDLRQTHAELGLALAQRGQLDAAIESFLRSLAIDPNQAQVLNNLGNAYRRNGRLDDAVARFREALRLDPAHAEASANLADALVSQGKLDEAIARYADVLAREPSSADAHYKLGYALGRQGRMAEAVGHFEECVRLEPGHALALYQLGFAAAMAGQVERAIERYRESLRHAPDRTETLMNLAWIYATDGDAKVRDGAEAVRLASRASELLGGQHAGALATLAAALAQDGRFAEATETARRALNLARMSGQRDVVGTLEETVRKYEAGELMYPVK